MFHLMPFVERSGGYVSKTAESLNGILMERAAIFQVKVQGNHRTVCDLNRTVSKCWGKWGADLMIYSVILRIQS